jgi:hypothetical protein
MITEKQKNIYNSFLINSRKAKNQPFKVRTNFDKMSSNDINILIRLEYFFNRFSDVDMDMYFTAPYKIWKDKDYFPLDYFLSQQATKAYTLYKKQLLDDDIDSEEILNKIKEGLSFIAKFCIKNNLSLRQYYTHKSGLTFSWMKHIRRGNILPYITFGFPKIDDIFYSTPEDERDMLLGSFSDKFYIYKSKFNKSKNAKFVIKKGLTIIEKWIEKEKKPVD